MYTQHNYHAILSLSFLLTFCGTETAQPISKIKSTEEDQTIIEVYNNEINNQIRREKFDLIVPNAMRKNNIDMWIHIMRDAISDLNIQKDNPTYENDLFGAEDLGSSSGVFVFTDRGGDRIERAVIGRRWGATQRQRTEDKSHLIEKLGVYDIIHDPIFVAEPLASPKTEYDFRF